MAYSRYFLYKRQFSYDGGQTWVDTDPLETTINGDPIATYNTLEECESGGFKFYATYNDDHTEYGDCASSSEINSNDLTKNGIKTLDIGPCATLVKRDIFSGCTTLTSLSTAVSKTHLDISHCVFSGCTNLQNVTLSEGASWFGGYVFANCTSLSGITFPSTTIWLGGYILYGCSNLQYITCLANWPPEAEGGGQFDNTGNCPIYVPDASVNLYKEEGTWYLYEKRIKPLSEKP